MKFCIDCGKKISRYAKRCIKCSNLSKERAKKSSLAKINEKNPMWKGNEVSYRGLHTWVTRHKPKPKFCEECGIKKPYDLANISGKYKRDVNDFEWICRSCHMKKDKRIKNLIKNEKRKHKGNLIQCTKCKKFKTKENFVKDKFRWDGIILWCKKCKEKDIERKEKKKEYDKKYRQKHKKQKKAYNTNRGFKKK